MATANSNDGSNQTQAQAQQPPPEMLLYQLASGHFVSHALALAAKLGIADRVAESGSSVEELARATKTDATALRRVLRLLVSVGVFEEDESGAIRLNAASAALRSDIPGSMKALVTVFAGSPTQGNWKELEYCVRTGRPAFKKDNPDADPFTAMMADPETAAIFDKAMATFAPQTAAAVAAAYDFSPFRTLVDVGGGNGALLRGILTAFPAVRGVLFDRPDVIERARSSLDAAPESSRIELVAGSFFESIPGGHDAYLLKHVIHDWNDQDAGAILRGCRRAMQPQGRVLVVEGIYPARVVASPLVHGATATDVNMLVCTGGRQRSEAEFRALFDAAGFELTRVVPTRARVSVIEGKPR